jgi:hypothetical protein
MVLREKNGHNSDLCWKCPCDVTSSVWKELAFVNLRKIFMHIYDRL